MRETSLECAEEATIAPEKLSLYSAHEIIHRISSIHSINLIYIIEEISHSSSSLIQLSHGIHDAWAKKTIEKGIFRELFKSL